MSRDRRSRSRARAWHLIADDPYRKLVAIGLAILLWFFINSRIVNSVERNLQLAVVTSDERADFEQLALVLPPDVVVRRFLDGETPIERVELVLSGPRFRVDALAGQPLSLVIRKFLTRDWGRARDGADAQQIETLEFSADDIVRNLRELQGIEIEMRPAVVRVEYERFANMSFERPDELVEVVADGFDETRLRRSTATYSPRVVTILGPAVSIAKLSGRAPLFRAVLRGSGNEDQVSGMLEIINGDALGVKFEVQPLVQMQLFPKREAYDVTLPVFVDDLGLDEDLRGRYAPEQETLAVRVSFAGDLGRAVKIEGGDDPQGWAEQNLRLVVHIARPQPGARLGDELQRRPHLTLVGPLLQRYGRSEYLLEDSRTVTLRRKQQ